MNGSHPAEYDAVIAEARPGRADVVILTLRPAQPLRWRAGQYISLAMEEFAPRYYSLANAPLQDALPEIHARKGGPEGLSAWLVRHAKPGMAVRMTGPFGDLTLDPEDRLPLLLVAGGLGIAPLKALTEQALAAGRPALLVWGTNYPEDQYMKAGFEALERQNGQFRFISVTENPVSQSIAALIDDFSPYRIYLAGPPAMIIATKSLLNGKNVDTARIRHDPLPSGSGSEGRTGAVSVKGARQ